MVSGPFPVLVSVSAWLFALLGLKEKMPAEQVRIPIGVRSPVPLSGMISGLPGELWVSCSWALRAPTSVGWNQTDTVSCPFSGITTLPAGGGGPGRGEHGERGGHAA